MECLRFFINDRLIEERSVSPTTTLLRYLRDNLALTGTKEGCAEGDCGACSVAVLEAGSAEKPHYRTVCSCLVLLPMVQGKRVYTVEGLKDGTKDHVVQDALSRALGSQCGYCTPGVTMALFETCYREDLDEPWKLDAAMCGNLCRCTGYRPIRDAARNVAGLRPDDRFLTRLAREEPEPMDLAYATQTQKYFTPSSFEALWEILDAYPDARFVAGGTDLSLEVTKKFAEPPRLVSLEALPELRELESTADGFRFGAAVNLSRLESFTRFSLPPMERILRYFGSRQIKNRATIGGNLCTASPIGDLAPVFLALGATVGLRSKAGVRDVPIDEFFVGYRRTALAPREILAYVDLPRPMPGARVSSYKVSKRRELDISTVSAAYSILVDEGGIVREARLAYGGMAATPARAKKTEAALIGRPWTEAEVRSAAEKLADDFRPLSDHRGSAWYRAKVAANLLRGFYLETRETLAPRLPGRPTATVEGA